MGGVKHRLHPKDPPPHQMHFGCWKTTGPSTCNHWSQSTEREQVTASCLSGIVVVLNASTLQLSLFAKNAAGISPVIGCNWWSLRKTFLRSQCLVLHRWKTPSRIYFHGLPRWICSTSRPSQLLKHQDILVIEAMMSIMTSILFLPRRSGSGWIKWEVLEEIRHQLRLVVYPHDLQGALYIPGGCLGFLNHQQNLTMCI